MNDFQYVGSELEVFALAVNWKSYCRSKIRKYLRGDVLEVGAGIGGTARLLCDGRQSAWICLEPDAKLANQIDVAKFPASTRSEVIVGTLDTLAEDRLFDAVLYSDVLEHIEDDKAELERAAMRLRPGGALVVVAPAHQFLFTPFDRAIGHFRRYNKDMLRRAAPSSLRLETLLYLDSVGFFASLANRLVLQSAYPSAAQIRVWDQLMVPLSRVIDRLLAYSAGKSVIAIWRMPDSPQA